MDSSCWSVLLAILHNILLRVARGDDGGGLGSEAASSAVHTVHPGHCEAGEAVEHEEEDEAHQPSRALVIYSHPTLALW